MNLIVNPLAGVERTEDGSLVCGGPIPGRGTNFLSVSASEMPRLHTLFTELMQIGLSNLEIATDLTEADVPLLVEHGILIAPDNVPERPLFSCMLGDVEPIAPMPSSPVVNPTLDYQPFDLTKFRSWMQEKYLSPHHATAWVTDPKTGARWGYWLTPSEAETVAALREDRIAVSAIDSELASRLYEASVIVDPEPARSSVLDEAASNFSRDRYVAVDGLIPSAQIRALQKYIGRFSDQGFMRYGDSQVPRRFAAHGEPVASMFHHALEPVMHAITRIPLRRTYAYSAVYVDGAELVPHVDREACVFSFSCQVDYVPAADDGISPWSLYLAANEPGDLSVDPATDIAVNLRNGGLLAYKGRELVHYRTPLPEGHRSTSIFFHYVPAD